MGIFCVRSAAPGWTWRQLRRRAALPTRRLTAVTLKHQIVLRSLDRPGCRCVSAKEERTRWSSRVLILHSLLQKRTLRLRLAFQRRHGACLSSDTEAKLLELCSAEGWDPEGSDGEDVEEGTDNSEPLEDSDIVLSDSGKGGRTSSGNHSATLKSFIKMQFWFGQMVSRWWFGGLWQDGLRAEEDRKGESFVSHLHPSPCFRCR